MPVFSEDPSQFSKERLKSELIAHKVALPPTDSKKQEYLELYLKNVDTKNAADFSSDEEEERPPEADSQAQGAVESDMRDLSGLTDEELKARLLQHGFQPGPITATTRYVYEKKLRRLMEPKVPAQQQNGSGDKPMYSDSEEEENEEEEEEEEEEREEEQPDPSLEAVSFAEKDSAHSKMETHSVDGYNWYPQCFMPAARLIERKRSISPKPQSDAVFNCYSDPRHKPLQRRPQVPVTDVLMEVFPDSEKTPTGIFATRRRPIKGAAGRPVQFKYPDTPLSPNSLDQQEAQHRQVPLWVQLVIFIVVTLLLYVTYSVMEDSFENPLTLLLDGLNQAAEVIEGELAAPAVEDAASVVDAASAGPLPGE